MRTLAGSDGVMARCGEFSSIAFFLGRCGKSPKNFQVVRYC